MRARTSGDHASRNRGRTKEDNNIEEGIALLVKRDLEGKKILKCWICNEFDHYASKCPKRVRKYKRSFKPRRPRECL
jgi:hypothetical protein